MPGIKCEAFQSSKLKAPRPQLTTHSRTRLQSKAKRLTNDPAVGLPEPFVSLLTFTWPHSEYFCPMGQASTEVTFLNLMTQY